MSDLTLTCDSEWMVVHAEASTENAEEFLDAYTTPDLVVVDSGRIIVPEAGKDALLAAARQRGLTWDEVTS